MSLYLFTFLYITGGLTLFRTGRAEEHGTRTVCLQQAADKHPFVGCSSVAPNVSLDTSYPDITTLHNSREKCKVHVKKTKTNTKKKHV